MFRVLVIVCIILLSLAGLAHLVTRHSPVEYTPQVKVVYHQLGERLYPVRIEQYGERTDVVFIALHDDEETSVEAAKTILKEQGGLLIEIENDSRRNLAFRMNGRMYRIDPNRMFSRTGINKSMDELGIPGKTASMEIERFAARILDLLPSKSTIIALHNNSDGNFSAKDYAPGNRKAKEAAKVHINDELDPDDFYLTTETELFNELKDKNYNVILQEKIDPIEDGSLSVYCVKKEIRYVNLETEHGKHALYHAMLSELMGSL